jgi:putative inorganic carbon (hco3(-)) transporter
MSVGEIPAPRVSAVEGRRLAAGALAILFAVLLAWILVLLGAPSRLALVAALGVAGLGLLTRPRTATLLFIAILYLNVPVVAMRFHCAPDLIVAIAPLPLLVPVLSYVVIRRQALVVTPALFWMVAYLAALIVAAFFSGDVEDSTRAVMQFATEGLVLYLLMTNAVRTFATVRAAVVVLLVVGAFLGGLSLFQEVTKSYDNPYWGFAQTKEVDPDEPVVTDGRPRLSGPIGSKNRYAQAMLVLLPLALFGYLTARSRLYRGLSVAAGILILAGVLLTFSRGAGVALIALVLIAIMLRSIRPRTAILMGVTAIAAMFLIAPDYYDRIESVTGVGAFVSEEADRPDGAILGRATSNLAALNVFLDHPLVGVGPGQYASAYSRAYANELGLRHFTTSRRAHNLYLEIAADAGIVGLVAFLGIVGATMIGLWRCRKRWLRERPEYAFWATAFLLSVTGYMLSATFLHLAYMRYFWFLIALANGVIWLLNSKSPESPHPQPTGSSARVSRP